ncbi:MAG: hypothetical protein ABSE87_11905 [Terracidiphilus sp.]
MKSQKARPSRMKRTQRARTLWVCVLAGLAAVALAPVAGEGLFQNPYPHIPPEMTRIPDNNQVNDINDQQAKKQSFEAANAERKKQIADDSAKLLKLATDLKAEVDKTNKDTLSLNVIRKADEIERLAHSVKEKMKLTVGAS